MWILPLLVVGAIVAAVASRSKRDLAPPSRQLAARTPTALPGAPGPISVLGEILRVGQTPPPTVILCAIAEAQSIGRNDLASDIVKVFVAPVVYYRQRGGPRSRRRVDAQYARGSCELPRSPRAEADASSPTTRVPPAPFYGAAPPPPPIVPRADVTASDLPAAPGAPSAVAPSVDAPTSPMSMDDEINALLHADPARFMELVSRSGTFPSTARAPQPPVGVPTPFVPTPPVVLPPSSQPTGRPSETVAQMQEAAGLPETDDRVRALVPGSPIPGVSDAAWRNFVAQLSREAPEFSSSRHVGQYRQRRERLAELGIDPAAIADSAQAQRTALDTDLAEAYRHGVASELFSQHLGRPIMLPGRQSAEMITLSGVLGVIQCAGLEGAVGWLERPGDRKRYPHTTQAFGRTNGAF